MEKTHPAAAPQIVGGMNVFGDKRNLRVPADQLVVLRAALGGDHRQDRAAVGRRNRHPSAEFETRFGNNAESKLIDIKLQRSIVIANKNIRLENTQIGTL